MEKTWKPTTGGILNIITGAMGIGGGVILFLLSGLLGTLGAVDPSRWMEDWQGSWWGPGAANIPEIVSDALGVGSMWLMVAGIVVLVFGIIALVGGISSIKRQRWGLALAGSILSLFIMPVMAVLAIIFIALGKKEFE